MTLHYYQMVQLQIEVRKAVQGHPLAKTLINSTQAFLVMNDFKSKFTLIQNNI